MRRYGIALDKRCRGHDNFLPRRYLNVDRLSQYVCQDVELYVKYFKL
jgi:hypothetical protein